MNRLIRELAEKSNLAIFSVAFGGQSVIQNEAEIEKFVELLLEEVDNVICSCDPSPKMILHQPYRKIMNAIDEHFLNEEDPEEIPGS